MMRFQEKTSCDVAIIGAGPAGLATADTLKEAGHDCLVFDAGSLAHNLTRLPRYMDFYSRSDLLEIRGFPLVCPSGKPSRREYLAYLARFCKDREIALRLWERVMKVERSSDGGFQLETLSTLHPEQSATVKARFVVLATGAYETPNTLNVPGENSGHVHHYYEEPHLYFGKKVLVVGSGNSACESALELWHYGVDVSLMVRGAEFGFVKYWVKPDIENRIKEGSIPAYFQTSLTKIEADKAFWKNQDGETGEVEADFVLALVGYRPNLKLLENCGIEVCEEDCRPLYNPATLETNVRGLFVAGVIGAGTISAEIFIENSRFHGEIIRDSLEKNF